MDGQWHAALDRQGRANQYPTRPKSEFTLDLKVKGSELKGHVVTHLPRRSLSDKIMNGHLEGANFSFVTVAKRRRMEQRFNWSGSIENGVLHGYRTPFNASSKGQPFTAVR